VTAPGRHTAITDAWVAAALADPRSPASRGLAGRFRNPAAHRLGETMAVLVEQLLGPMDPAVVMPALVRLGQVRAVHDARPSRALAIVFRVRAILEDERRHGDDDGAIARAEARVDELALLAFDAYVDARERLHRAQVNELCRRAAILGRMVADEVGAPAHETPS
jgi:hypothetical protein